MVFYLQEMGPSPNFGYVPKSISLISCLAPISLYFLPTLILHIFLVHQNQSIIHNTMKESIVHGVYLVDIQITLITILGTCYCFFFWTFLFSGTFGISFSVIIKHCVFHIFLFLFFSLQMIFVLDLLIEYHISTLNDFVIFTIHKQYPKSLTLYPLKVHFLDFSSSFVLFSLSIWKITSQPKVLKCEYFSFLPIHASYRMPPSKELEGILFIK